MTNVYLYIIPIYYVYLLLFFFYFSQKDIVLCIISRIVCKLAGQSVVYFSAVAVGSISSCILANRFPSVKNNPHWLDLLLGKAKLVFFFHIFCKVCIYFHAGNFVIENDLSGAAQRCRSWH